MKRRKIRRLCDEMTRQKYDSSRAVLPLKSTTIFYYKNAPFLPPDRHPGGPLLLQVLCKRSPIDKNNRWSFSPSLLFTLLVLCANVNKLTTR
ncbi:hypothetical protein [Mixta sp. Marseille-Q2659]|uniref:hypothetical protein n=1 Tax=Mixta sp. Marseille-Q2659 TaxID=2736607 RepID=UPI0023B914F7|nr:hypothetical protein [Mixta sp. Marseille-Q2659]